MLRSLLLLIAAACLTSCSPKEELARPESGTAPVQSQAHTGVYKSGNGTSIELFEGGKFKMAIGGSTSEGNWSISGPKLILEHLRLNGTDWSAVAAEIAAGKRSPSEGICATYVEGTIDPSGNISFPETKDAYGNVVPNSSLTLSKN